MTDLLTHPALVHAPLGIALAVPLASLVTSAQIARGRWPESTFGLVAALAVLASVGAFVAAATGEDEALRLASAGDAWLQAVRAHEHAADRFVWSCAAVALAAIAATASRRERLRATMRVAITVLSLIVAVLAVLAGHAGGQLVHPRFQSTFSPAE